MDASTAQLVKSVATHGRKMCASLELWANEQEALNPQVQTQPLHSTLWLIERVLSLVKGITSAAEAWLCGKQGRVFIKPQRRRPKR